MKELHELAGRARERGDDCLGVMLAGVELHIALGRELELLDWMRSHVQAMRDAVAGTPSAEDLERLYREGEEH